MYEEKEEGEVVEREFQDKNGNKSIEKDISFSGLQGFLIPNSPKRNPPKICFKNNRAFFSTHHIHNWKIIQDSTQSKSNMSPIGQKNIRIDGYMLKDGQIEESIIELEDPRKVIEI